MKPHQIGISISYDGTWSETLAETVEGGTSSGDASYTVVKGDSLWGISKKFYGTGTKYSVIYNANVDIIESTAKAHGKKSSDSGRWIWPGETLTIPEG